MNTKLPVPFNNESVHRIGASLLIIFSVVAMIAFRANNPKEHLVPVSVIAIIGGIAFEGLLISPNVKKFFILFAISLAGSVASFIPGKKERLYSLESHIAMWPYFFAGIFVLILIITYKKEVTRQLTEGITLLQSVAVVYWVINYGFLGTADFFLTFLMLCGLAFALYTAWHAFTYTPLSVSARLWLSLWSSVVMLLFAADHVYRVCQNKNIENTDMLSGYYIGLQYFLLGISVIYSAQNLNMLLSFLPGKKRFFNAKYFEDIKELKQDHIDRYSNKQVRVRHALYCLLFSAIIFGINYYLNLLPGHIAIWSVFVVFPYLIMLNEYVIRKKAAQRSQPES